MAYRNVGIIILAAGKGKRMKSDLPKVLHQVAGKSMVVRVVETARKIASDHVHVVIGYRAEDVKKEVSQYFSTHFAVQEQLIGTGDAVKSALPGLDSTIEDVVVLCGDVPLIKEETIVDLIERHQQQKAKVSVMAVEVDDPTGYGRIVIDDQQNILCIKEQADATEEEQRIKMVNSGIYCFSKAFVSTALDAITPDNNQGEYYLTDLVEIAKNRGEKIIAVIIQDPIEVTGVNTLAQLEWVESRIQE